MSYVVQFQISIFSLIILFVLYLYVRLSKINTFSKGLIRMAIVTTAIGIVVDPLAWIFDSRQFPGAFFLEYGTNFLLVLMAPITAGLLISYMDYRVNGNPGRIYNRWYYQQVSFVTLIILIINDFYPVYFHVDRVTNSYSDGRFSFVHNILIFGLYLFMLHFISRHIRKIALNEALVFIACFTLPILGIIIQSIEVMLHFTWPSVVVVLVVFYIFLETMPMEEDYLTKLYNRQSYELHLANQIHNGRNFGMLIMDMNGLKQINDRYGHKKGDEAIVAFAKTLKKVFRKTDFVARLGGDEFVVIVDSEFEDVAARIGGITEKLRQETDPVIRNLTFSYGFHVYDESMTQNELYVEADKRMYAHKQTSKG